MRASRDLENKLENFNEKLNEIKSDYLTKENDFKSNKSKIRDAQVSIDALKSEYADAKTTLQEIAVSLFNFYARFFCYLRRGSSF
jgi:chromosome segregation ATPase